MKNRLAYRLLVDISGSWKEIAVNSNYGELLEIAKSNNNFDWIIVKLKQSSWLMSETKRLAESYHDRQTMSGTVVEGQTCGCCGCTTNSTVSVEHDGQKDYSKDLKVCNDCYQDIFTYWAENKPNKIAPPFKSLTNDHQKRIML